MKIRQTLKKAILGDLEIGDIFMHASEVERKGKGKEFIVIGAAMFNARHGRATRKCIDLKNKVEVGKSCPMEVYKVRESKHKAALLEKHSVQRIKQPNL